MCNKLDIDLDKKNRQIFKYLHLNGWIPPFTIIDKDMGYSNRYFYKFASAESKVVLKPLHTFAFETKYQIPASLFFNTEIKEENEIEPFIIEYRKNNNNLFENNSLESLESFKDYKYFYALVETNMLQIHGWKIFVENQKVKFQKFLNVNANFDGNIHISKSHIIMITENLVTNNNAVFTIKLSNLRGYNIIPIIYLGYSSFLDLPVADYGICSKEPLEEKHIKSILNLSHLNFSKREKEILNRIRR